MELGVPSRATSIFASVVAWSPASRPALLPAASLSAICRYPERRQNDSRSCQSQLERDQTGRSADRQHKAELGKAGGTCGRVKMCVCNSNDKVQRIMSALRAVK
jgi:hypothetical protein